MALLHHLLETATLKVPVLDRREGMPKPGRMQVLCQLPSIHAIIYEGTFMQTLGTPGLPQFVRPAEEGKRV